jgi:hypothetical protein
VGADVQRQEPPSKVAAREWSLTLNRAEDDVLGAALGDTDKGAVIINVQQGGLLDVWSEANLAPRLYPGLIITEVNGARGYWAILDALQVPGELELKISDQPPAHAGPRWFEDIAAMGRSLEKQQDNVGGGNGSFMLRLPQEGPSATSQFSSLPNVVAGDCGVDMCAICMDDVAPDETVVQLNCKHAFHATCAARWLTQNRGKRQCCPLCCQKVLCSPEDVLTLEEF